MSTGEIVERFYDGLAHKSDKWKDNLSEKIEFSDASHRLRAEGKEAFIQSFNSFLRGVERVQLKQLIIENGNAAAVVGYDYVSPKGNKLHQDDAEVWRVENGEIVALTIFFDITEFRNFMAS